MSTLVFYRLPHASRFTRLSQTSKPRTFATLDALANCSGFVIAPFEASTATPIVLVEAESNRSCDVETAFRGMRAAVSNPAAFTPSAENRAEYAHDFSAAHGRLVRGELQKLVLSRRLYVKLDCRLDEEALEQLFLTACRDCANCYVALWHTAEAGTWLTATPEVLLERRGGLCSTIALAGTMPRSDAAPWSEKNRKEQALVADYVRGCVEPLSERFEESPVRNLEVGGIKHLCTDFRFSLRRGIDTCAVLRTLHPTPAVCGTPQAAARAAVESDESRPRRYYAGFSGYIGTDEAHLYVSLRCLQLTEENGVPTAVLYAGGGLLADSVEANEWEETQRKMEPMRRVLCPQAL